MKLFLIIALLASSLAACGEDQTVSSGDADQIASKLAQKTQSLSDQVADARRALADDPDRADEARDRLRDLQDRAQELAGEAKDLPEPANGRAELQAANEQIAEAAGKLADADPGSRDEAVDQARAQIAEAKDHIGEAADRLADKLPPDARKDLDDLREKLSSATP